MTRHTLILFSLLGLLAIAGVFSMTLFINGSAYNASHMLTASLNNAPCQYNQVQTQNVMIDANNIQQPVIGHLFLWYSSNCNKAYASADYVGTASYHKMSVKVNPSDNTKSSGVGVSIGGFHVRSPYFNTTSVQGFYAEVVLDTNDGNGVHHDIVTEDYFPGTSNYSPPSECIPWSFWLFQC